MKKIFNKRIIILVISLVIILLAIGLTRANWFFNLEQKTSNEVGASCVNFSLSSNKEAIVLKKTYPISDEAGMNLTPYTFTLTNNCNEAVKYIVYLETIGDKTSSLKAESIKVMIDEDDPKTLDKYDLVDPTIDEAYSSYIITEGNLNIKDEVAHNLRLWMDYDVTREEGNKTFKSKIAIKAIQEQ